MMFYWEVFIMSLVRTSWVAGPVGILMIACSGADATIGGDSDAATDAGSGADASSTGDAASDSGGRADGGTTGGDSGFVDAAAGGDASAADAAVDAGACPDEHGKYTVIATGLGCGDLAPTAPQCIQQSAACRITLLSSGSAGAKALNGTADLAGDGSFTGAAIKEGTVNRTGCVGSWDAQTSTLTVDCGGVASSQSCRAVLTRTSMNCN